MLYNLIMKIFKTSPEEKLQKFLKKYKKLCDRHHMFISPIIIFYRNEKEITDQKELEEIRNKINELLKKDNLGISVKLIIQEKDDSK